MCTLTAISFKNKIVVTMNRDEARIRDEASSLKNTHSIDGTRLVYPVDLTSNGSWFGINDSGVVLGLLNRYQEPLNQNVVSRGTIIPKALSLGGVEEIIEFCCNLKVSNYSPFDLVLISNKKCYRFKWNGNDFNISPFTLEQPYFITSSSVDMENILTVRKQRFRDWTAQLELEKLTENEILQEFHLKQTRNKSHSVFMQREFSHTKSICQSIISNTSSQIYYLPFSGFEKTANKIKSTSMEQTVILPFKSL
jgi:uncharacterized protein with NRDE domain